MLRGRRAWVFAAVFVPVGLAVAFGASRGLRAEEAPPLTKLTGTAAAAAAVAPPSHNLAGLDLTKLEVKPLASVRATAKGTDEQVVTTTLADKKLARLSIDPALQHVAEGVMGIHHLPEAAVVLMDVQTGKILVYASHVEKGPARDLCVEATAPAASVFKVITGTSLVENAGVTPDQRECYNGGEQKILDRDLVRDPKRDKWCSTVAGAMGRSLNTVFARLALEKLKPTTLEETAHSLGFGSALPFDVPVHPSTIKIPEDQLGYARTAAGFWNTTLSPIHAAWISGAVARSGEPVRPTIVSEVLDDGKAIWTAPSGLAQKRVMKADTAHAITTMMESTVSDGTSYRAFHDGRGRAFLPGISVAGKTGTLTDAAAQRYYTWFTGFAPSKPITVTDPDGKDPQPRQVSFGVLVVNDPQWSIKANVLAREVLRAYFASQNVPNVTMPSLTPPARGEDNKVSKDKAEKADKKKRDIAAHRL